MENYRYRARTKKGQLVQGKISADDLKAAKKAIAAQGLIPIECKKSGDVPGLRFFVEKFDRFNNRVPIEQLIIFNRQLQIVYSVGINIMLGLQMIHDQASHPVMKKAVGGIVNDISEGSSLHDAMAKHPDIFDSVYLNLIKVGETTGELESLLERASEMAEQQAEQKQKVKSALFYPKLVLGFMSIVMLVIVYFVLPKLKTFFTGMGAELPPITKFVMGTSDFFVDYWYLVLVVGVGIYVAWSKFSTNPRGRVLIDTYLLRLPIFGSLILEIEMNSFCILLELLIKSGVAITDAFKLVASSSGNSIVSKDIERCRKFIEDGGSISEGFSASKIFPPFVTNLLSMGEGGGSLPMVLNKIAAYYKIQVDHKLNNLSKLIEPILLFFIFGMVLVLALAVFLPMWKMSSAIKK